MYKETQMLFMYVEEKLHAGTGRGLGAVDLPIQRERTTGYPFVQASSIKGKLRSQLDPAAGNFYSLLADPFNAIFGPEDTTYAGCLSFSDARLLLFPVRSLAGVFSWTTSADVLRRFQRALQAAKMDIDLSTLPTGSDQALVSPSSALITGRGNTPKRVVLEEYSFTPQEDAAVAALGTALAEFLPDSPAYAYWKETLPAKLCILPENAFRDFTLYATEIQNHIRLDPLTKTVKNKMLWNSESLPADSFLYASLMASPPHTPVKVLDENTARSVLARMGESMEYMPRLQLGGDETTGHGIVALKMVGGAS
jgi:CRISPR-associated protein Cmr4